MNTTTAATQAKVTVATIRNWCRRGVIAATKQAGRWLIDDASLARRIEIGTRRMTNPAHGIDENTLRDIRRARLARPHHLRHSPDLEGRYLLPSMGYVSHRPMEKAGLVERITTRRGRIQYVLSAKAERIRAAITTN
ncbi:helix-turn-helix domain-containing protein [Streptomyces sp. AD55]|uniref:helix-turn-helix domain-containing protein n=1 Tax=Streptomyces sp. AD55 TaxID=3242895 RepID=UPI003528FBBD